MLLCFSSVTSHSIGLLSSSALFLVIVVIVAPPVVASVIVPGTVAVFAFIILFIIWIPPVAILLFPTKIASPHGSFPWRFAILTTHRFRKPCLSSLVLQSVPALAVWIVAGYVLCPRSRLPPATAKYILWPDSSAESIIYLPNRYCNLTPYHIFTISIWYHPRCHDSYPSVFTVRP